MDFALGRRISRRPESILDAITSNPGSLGLGGGESRLKPESEKNTPSAHFVVTTYEGGVAQEWEPGTRMRGE